jgi:hypothetical protein
VDSLSEEFKKRLHEKPDVHTLAWWRSEFQEVLRAYRGINHGTNCVLVYNEDLAKANKELRDKIAIMEAAGEADRAKIGELQTSLVEVVARLDRQGEFLNELKKAKPKENSHAK